MPAGVEGGVSEGVFGSLLGQASGFHGRLPGRKVELVVGEV